MVSRERGYYCCKCWVVLCLEHLGNRTLANSFVAMHFHGGDFGPCFSTFFLSGGFDWSLFFVSYKAWWLLEGYGLILLVGLSLFTFK